jgi:uncharacterized SAM-binding protein YcdF (DUF218 family)
MSERAGKLWAERQSAVRRAWAALSQVAAVFFAFYLLITLTPVLRPWLFWLSTPWGGEVPEVVLVLGGDEQAPGLIGYSTYLRLHYAARFWRTGQIKRFVLSGGSSGGRPLAEAMAEFLRGYGVPPEAMVLEDRSHSTWENIGNSKALLDALPGRKALLTSDYHMRRAIAVCRRQGLQIEPLTVPEGEKRLQAPLQRWPLLLTLGTETGKLIWYRAAGRL